MWLVTNEVHIILFYNKLPQSVEVKLHDHSDVILYVRGKEKIEPWSLLLILGSFYKLSYHIIQEKK